jgi:signal peptidase I
VGHARGPLRKGRQALDGWVPAAELAFERGERCDWWAAGLDRSVGFCVDVCPSGERVKQKDTTMRRETEDEANPKSLRTLCQEYSEAFVVAVILAILIRGVLVQAFKIPSSSMEQTLLVGDHILVNKFIYGIRIPFTPDRWPKFRDPARDDVIVFIFPEDRTKDFIKRVVAVEGDTVEIRDKRVILNGKEVKNPHAQYLDRSILPAGASPRDNMRPLKVPPGRLFVMGDNRDHSLDSRFWGTVPVEDVRGSAFLIYYSAGTFPGVRWNRFFNIIR